MRAGAITLAIDSQFDHVFLVGVVVRAVCVQAGFAEEETAGVELCVVEAVNNCVEHAYREEPGHRVEVRLALAGGALRLEVRDRGRRMDWAAACARADACAADPAAEGGRGIFILRSLMDEVGYTERDGANVLTLCKSLPAAPHAAEARRPSGA
jgi:serine/threonine-protein kinase RsbW